MSEDRNPLDELIDLVVYAPLGLISNLRAELPRLAEKGREEWASKTTMYRTMGQFAVKEAQKKAEKTVRDTSDRVADLTGSRPQAPAAQPNRGPTPTPPPPPSTGAAVNGSAPKPDVNGLAIPGYDSLSASQVVQRLAGLDGDELAAVGSYERATRGRRTVINRIAQLQGA